MSLPFDPTADLYKTLGVKSDASAAEIKKAYHRLAKRYHPDTTGGDKAKEAKFKEISTAYDVLGDAEKRAQYDAFRTGPEYGYGPGTGPGAGPGPGAYGFPGGARAGAGGMPDIGSLFAEMFSGGGQPGGRQVRYEFRGGANPFGATDPDDYFGGNGFRTQRRRARRRHQPAPPHERKVRASDGSRLIQRGADVHSDVRIGIDQALLGTVVQVPTLSGNAKVKVPPGTSSGAKLRLRGQGSVGANGQVGDHIVTVQIDVPKRVNEKAKKLLVELMHELKK